jgi:hypothetical protein
MKWPISSHSNQAGHHAPCHHAECQHKLVALCSDPLVLPVSLVVPVGVALSFVAEQRRRIVAAASAAAGEQIAVVVAAAAADSQHYTVAEVLDRSLLERTCFGCRRGG